MHRQKNSYQKALAEGLLLIAPTPTVYDGVKGFARQSPGSVVIEHRRDIQRADAAGGSVSNHPSKGHVHTERYLKKG